MNKHSFQKGIEDIKKISMTHAEKQAMLKRVTSIQFSEASIKSPWSVYSFGVWVRNNKWSYAVVAVLIIFGAGSGIVSATQGTLPGDTLYPLKVSVVEPLRGTFAVTSDSQAEYQSVLATARLQEAETLATQGNLDAPKQAQLDALLTQHVSAFNNALQTNGTTSDEQSSSSEKIARNFKANMNAHARLLETIGEQSDMQTKGNVDHLAELARKDSAAPTQDSAAPVSASVTTRALKIKSADQSIDPTYFKHKKLVENLIAETNANLNDWGTSSDSLDQSIVSGTVEVLNQAQNALDQADVHNAEGNDNAAKDAIVQSEQAATEAGIYLKAGLQLKDIKHNKAKNR